MKKPFVFSLFLLLVFSAPAHAHPSGEHGIGWVNGFAHPVGGLDHLCAMLAVGVWAAQCGGRARWIIPLSFISIMALGGGLGSAGVVLPMIEQSIAASVLVLGVLIACAVKMPVPLAGTLVGIFALFHGDAHGAEMPAAASGIAYGAGFVVATAFLHAAGFGIASLVSRTGQMQWTRFAGSAIAACGLYLCLVA